MNHIAIGRHDLEEFGRNLIDEFVMIVGAAITKITWRIALGAIVKRIIASVVRSLCQSHEPFG
jgi:hypothetical protein